jgi:hypothetical protein
MHNSLLASAMFVLYSSFVGITLASKNLVSFFTSPSPAAYFIVSSGGFLCLKFLATLNRKNGNRNQQLF